MDSDTNDKSSSTGSTSVLRVAGLATLQQVPARVFLGMLGRESQNNPVKKKPYARATVSHATLQELLGLTFEPFANLSPPFRELSPAVSLHHASPCLYHFKHGFLEDPHVCQTLLTDCTLQSPKPLCIRRISRQIPVSRHEHP